jgi:hypothetical protein
MKRPLRIILFVALIFPTSICLGQGILNQKGSQIKNLVKQIALLKVYLEALRNGYEIAKTGLKTISDIKKGDFQLHLDYFDGLKKVRPGIKKYYEVLAIIELDGKIKKIAASSKKISNNEPLVRKEEKSYIDKVFSNLLDQSKDNMDELQKLSRSGNYALKDDERLKRIEWILSDMQDKYSFAVSFQQDLKQIMVQRYKEKLDTEKSKQLYNLK